MFLELHGIPALGRFHIHVSLYQNVVVLWCHDLDNLAGCFMFIYSFDIV